MLEPGRWLERVRAAGNEILAKYVGRTNSPLAAAVLLGAREQLDADRVEAFVETGAIHLLVIAGLHLGFAGAVLGAAMSAVFPAAGAPAAVAAMAVVYALTVDANPPVIRAAVMIVAMYAAAWFGRRALGMNSLAIAALVVLAINPSDSSAPGPSCPSSASPVSCGPDRDGFGGRGDAIPSSGWFGPTWVSCLRTLRQVGGYYRGLFFISLTVWLLTLPLVMARFHLITPVAMLLNPLVWAPMSLALVSGLATLLLGGWAPPLAIVSGMLCNGCLWLVESLVALRIGPRGAISGRPVPPIGGFWAFMRPWPRRPRFPGSARRGDGPWRFSPSGSPSALPPRDSAVGATADG